MIETYLKILNNGIIKLLKNTKYKHTNYHVLDTMMAIGNTKRGLMFTNFEDYLRPIVERNVVISDIPKTFMDILYKVVLNRRIRKYKLNTYCANCKWFYSIPIISNHKILELIVLVYPKNPKLDTKIEKCIAIFSKYFVYSHTKTYIHEKMKDTISSRNMFISVANHELKTSLTTIYGYAGMLRKSISADDHKYLNWIGQILSESNRMKSMIDELLDIEHIKKALSKKYRFIFVDKGVGIPKQDIEKIFGGYFRASNTKRSVERKGFGMHLAKRIIDRHHGTIKIKSKVNVGTKVIIELPRAFEIRGAL